jgi:hypothetical protein
MSHIHPSKVMPVLPDPTETIEAHRARFLQLEIRKDELEIQRMKQVVEMAECALKHLQLRNETLHVLKQTLQLRKETRLAFTWVTQPHMSD